MTLLIFGLALFIITHLIPAFPKLRSTIIERINKSAYDAFFSIFSIASIVLIIFGLRQAPFESLYNPPSWGRHLNMLLMFFALYSFASNTKGTAPSSVKVWTAFPISWGVIIWATGHLFANGDVAHVILFSSFLGYGIISIISGRARGIVPITTKHPPMHLQLIFIIVILLVYVGLFWGHRYFTGMPLI